MEIAKQNILFIYDSELIPTKGGIERVTDLLANEFVRVGHKVQYLFLDFLDEKFTFDFPVKYTVFPIKGKVCKKNIDFLNEFVISNRINIVINQSGSQRTSKLFLSISKKMNLRIISCIHTNPTRFLRSFSETITLRNGNSIIDYINQFKYQILSPVLEKIFINRLKNHFKYVFENSHIVCFLSEKFKEELSHIYDGELHKYRSIPNPNTYQDDNETVFKKKQILYVGRLILWQKRPDRLINIWKQIKNNHPEWNLVFVGDGPARPFLEKMINIGDRVSFVGFQDPLQYYKESSVLCNVSDYEGWGMCITEAMQNGVVPVAFNSYASVTDIIDNEINGIIVDSIDEYQFASSLSKILNDDRLRAKLSNNAREKAKEFNSEKVFQMWHNLINEVNAL